MSLSSRLKFINSDRDGISPSTTAAPAATPAIKTQTQPQTQSRLQAAAARSSEASKDNAAQKIISDKKALELSAIQDRLQKDVAAELAKRKEEVEESTLRDIINEILIDYDDPGLNRQARQWLTQNVLNEIKGLGPLEVLLNDPTVSEVMVNGYDTIFIERKGKLVKSDVRFMDDAHVRRILDRIVAPLGRHIDDSNPMVDARLKDGSRVNAIIPPLALNGSTITIRKFSATPLQIEDLIRFNSLSSGMSEFLKGSVEGKLNILVSGGTGSGKTTLLNVLSAFIPADERIVTIEDAAELRLLQEHVVSLESRPANLEGTGAITIRDLVRNALRMRPDRIVVGEVRGGETLDMLQAMNTGHDGSMTTAHANTPRDAIARVETMVMMSGMELPVKAIRQQISGAFDLIVQQARLRDGSRKITSITEVAGMEGDIITMQEIFRFVNDGYDSNGKIQGHFEATGVRPRCLEKIALNGARIDTSCFQV